MASTEFTGELGVMTRNYLRLVEVVEAKDAEIERLRAYLTPIQLKHYRGEAVGV